MRFCANTVGMKRATRRRAGIRSRFMMWRIYHARFGDVFRPFVANCHDGRGGLGIVCVEVRMKQLRELGAAVLLTAAVFTPAIIAAQTPAPPGGGIPDLIG